MSTQRSFQLLIKPVGADCNLSCDYCFYLRTADLYASSGAHRMSETVLEQLIKSFLSYRFAESVFAWQGGEPTLAGLPFFQKAVELQIKHGTTGQIAGNSLQTNGLLIDDEWCRFLSHYKFLVGLSLDGPEEIHNQFRHTASGKGTWTRVMETSQAFARHGVAFNILCVVNARNVRLGAELLRWFVNNGFAHVQFIPCLEPGMAHNVPLEAYGDFLCDTFDYWRKDLIGKVSVRDFDGLVCAAADQPGVICTYGRTCNHYIVIEHNGDVYPCDFFVREGYRLGNVMDAPLHTFLETERYTDFAYRKNKVRACRGCPWRPYCHGGCQKDRLVNGTVESPTVLCETYKRFFDHAMPYARKLAKRLPPPQL